MHWKVLFFTSFLLVFFHSPAHTQQPTLIGEFLTSNSGPYISTTDARDPSNISVVDMNLGSFTDSAGKICHQFNRVYVADGTMVRQFYRSDLQSGPTQSFQSDSEVLDIEEGSISGQIVVLDRNGLKVVDFKNSPTPEILGSFPINSTQTTWGNLLERFGDFIYVTDCTLGGFRILDISKPSQISDLGGYSTSVKGGGKQASTCPTDIQLRNGLVSLVVKNSMELVQVGDFLYPEPVPLHVIKVPGMTQVELKNYFAFLVDGSRVRIVDIRQQSPNFGVEITSFETGQTITALKQTGNRLFVVCGEAGYQVWDVSDFS